MTQQSQTPPSARPRIGLVGRGRLGTTLAAALAEAGRDVAGPVGRGERPDADVVVLCVPDAEIPAAAAAVAGVSLVGHTSGATPLDALAAARAEGAFGLHPLQTFPEPVTEGALGRFTGVGCAIAGTGRHALATAADLADTLGMRPFEIDDAGRGAYHAAASVASNFLVTLQAAAERIAEGAGLEAHEARELLAPLVRATVDGWSSLGPERALTGPVVRGDARTVARQREAVEAAAPELLALFDVLVERTEALAGRSVVA
jgi:predicted short-subunit dehydrogenase-like oxidoreductase (DUF2520 family)